MAASVIAGKTALVTGASSGLGVEFAQELARLGCKLVIVARREELLKQVREELMRRHGVEVVIVTLDLAQPDAPKALHGLLRQQKLEVDVLINNAGFGLFGQDLDIPLARTTEMLQLDIVALTQLTKLVGKDMARRGNGYILQIASTAAFQPSPGYAAYAAAKAYVLSYGNALNFELRGSGVSCTVVSPGVTATEFLQVSGQKQNWFHRATMMSSAEVAQAGIRAMLARRHGLVTGRFNALGAWMTRLMPRPLLAWLSWRLMKTD
ncbi:MAG TPA: SDR family oxidoreductase [Solimonas sp.]|nr:SDR family oxidoreductase [Solimonas sp.]